MAKLLIIAVALIVILIAFVQENTVFIADIVTRLVNTYVPGGGMSVLNLLSIFVIIIILLIIYCTLQY